MKKKSNKMKKQKTGTISTAIFERMLLLLLLLSWLGPSSPFVFYHNNDRPVGCSSRSVFVPCSGSANARRTALTSTLTTKTPSKGNLLVLLQASNNNNNGNGGGDGNELGKFIDLLVSGVGGENGDGGGAFEVNGVPFLGGMLEDDDVNNNNGAAESGSDINGAAAAATGGGRGGSEKKSLEDLLSFDLKPREVVEFLDRFVISQADAKKVLAVAICDHYNHCRRCLQRNNAEYQPNNDNSNKTKKKKKKRSSNGGSSSNKDDNDILQLLEPLSSSSSSSSSSSANWEYAKPNVLLAGPTGVGKTYLLKCLAQLVGVPFVKADATKFSETGIVGRDAEDLVRDLVDKANGNVELASVGIIYLDEVDKIAGGGGDGKGSDHSRGSFNTRGVQNNFLKLLEDTEVSLERPTDMVIMNLPFLNNGNDNKPKSISTKNILFIFSGAFTNLDKDIRRKMEKKPFGLDITQNAAAKRPAVAGATAVPSMKDGGGGSAACTDEKSPRSYLRFAETADFIKAGLEPEFVGRVPVRVALDALDANDLKQILVGSEGSVLKQFVRDMEGYSINMTATDDALNEVAKLAEKEETGARGLVTILERTLRQHKYELPSTSITEFLLDKETVANPELGLHKLLATTTPDDGFGVLLRDLKRWEAKLNRQLPLKADAYLTDEAINYLILKALERNESAYSFATRHFGDDTLAAVVRRVHEATSQHLFPITLDLAKNPKAELQKWLELL